MIALQILLLMNYLRVMNKMSSMINLLMISSMINLLKNSDTFQITVHVFTIV